MPRVRGLRKAVRDNRLGLCGLQKIAVCCNLGQDALFRERHTVELVV